MADAYVGLVNYKRVIYRSLHNCTEAGGKASILIDNKKPIVDFREYTLEYRIIE